MSDYFFPIDAIYLWVDGNDPAWQERRQDALKKAHTNNLNISEESLSPARFRDNNELRYSLRSLERYAPWINQVHLVTDRQCPEWLNRSTVNLVDHAEILPENATYPVFNSSLIELCMHRICGLSEHFISFNDDFMLGAPVDKKDFFTPNGLPKVWFFKRNVRRFKQSLTDTAQTNLHPQRIATSHKIIIKKYNFLMPYGFKHHPRAHTKTSMEAMWQTFPEEIAKTLQLPFRDKESFTTVVLYSLYLLATKQGLEKRIDGLAKIIDSITGKHCNISVDLGDNRCFKRMEKIKKRKPLTFCINDCGKPEGNNRLQILQDFLNNTFPEKSKFEQ